MSFDRRIATVPEPEVMLAHNGNGNYERGTNRDGHFEIVMGNAWVLLCRLCITFSQSIDEFLLAMYVKGLPLDVSLL
jgi:hypothetical protein